MGELLVDPANGSVAFGSGKECWAFTVTKFARIYASKFKTSYDKLQSKFWGDNFFDAKAKKWKKEGQSEEGKPLKRAFAQFIMDPIINMARACMEGNTEQLNKMLDTVGVTLTQTERELTSKHLLKTVMAKWINAADTILEMIVVHLPSPRAA
eukprot:TRINITY_DN66965_c0_g1_i2.p2 TRINITY_DN66965_c0_g1~~TRINITY_DN66965_c0_g1_i2.p2  ORF type:complete len:153 (-),score=7.77 TRINITY_DN66965_c0_g1_i2:1599-2057(-)